MVGVVVQIAVSVCTLSVHRGSNWSIRLARHEDIQERETSVWLHFTCELDALFDAIQMDQQILNSLLGYHCTGVIHKKFPERKLDVESLKGLFKASWIWDDWTSWYCLGCHGYTGIMKVQIDRVQTFSISNYFIHLHHTKHYSTYYIAT